MFISSRPFFFSLLSNRLISFSISKSIHIKDITRKPPPSLVQLTTEMELISVRKRFTPTDALISSSFR